MYPTDKTVSSPSKMDSPRAREPQKNRLKTEEINRVVLHTMVSPLGLGTILECRNHRVSTETVQ